MELHGAFGRRCHKLMHQGVGALTHVLGGALGHNASIGQNDHLICNVKGLVQIVGHDHTGQSQIVVELTNEPGRRAQRDRVQARKGFVVHDQLGIQGNGSCQSNPSGHAP